MHKRIALRLVNELSEKIISIAKSRGISINALITEIAWEFVENWEEKNKKQ